MNAFHAQIANSVKAGMGPDEHQNTLEVHQEVEHQEDANSAKRTRLNDNLPEGELHFKHLFVG